MALSRRERKKQEKKRPFRRFLRITFYTILAALVLVVGAAAYVGNKVNNVTINAHKPLERGEHSQLREEVPDPVDDPVSILLLGLDTRDGDLNGRADAIVLATFNPSDNSIKMLSIPRDSYVELADRYKMDKINHAYAYGQAEMTISTVENLLGIPVDYYATLNFDAFMEIIDELGGIEVNSERAFTEVDDDTYGTIKIGKGLQTLNGQEALAYVRMRKSDPLGDIGRGERQKEVISSIIKKGASLKTLTNIGPLMDSVEKNLETNVKFGDIVSMHSYATKLNNIESLTLEGDHYSKNGVYYYKLKEESVEDISAILQEHLGHKQEAHLQDQTDDAEDESAQS